MPTDTLVIFDNQGIAIPWNWSCNEVPRTFGYQWNVSRTTIESAVLSVSASAPGQHYCDIRLNTTDVLAMLQWGAFEEGVVKQVSLDVKLFLKNGINLFKAAFCKNFYLPEESSCAITAILEITSSGDPPIVTPPSEQTELQWYHWLIIAGVAMVGVYAIAPAIVERSFGFAGSRARRAASKGIAYYRRK